MGFLNLLSVASMPVLKVLLITGLGSILALDHLDIMGDAARNHLNKLAYFVFNPSLVSSNLAKTITFESMKKLWFMPVNVVLTFMIGSALGWLLVLIAKPPPHLKGLILGSCSAGNLGQLPLIIIPAMCKEKGSPFGNSDVCYQYGMAYASLSMALGSILLWAYVYNILRIFSSKKKEVDDIINSIQSVPEREENSLPSIGCASSVDSSLGLPLVSDDVSLEEVKHVTFLDRLKRYCTNLSGRINITAVLAPSTIGALAGFAIGIISPVRKLIIGSSAPLHVIHDSASLLGDASILLGRERPNGEAQTLHISPSLKGPRVKMSLLVGIIAVRYVFLPIFGIIIVKGGISLGFIHSDPLYQFVLMLQFALPPAMNIGSMTQIFEAGEGECSVIMLWAYSLASVSLTLWSTFFVWMVS